MCSKPMGESGITRMTGPLSKLTLYTAARIHQMRREAPFLRTRIQGAGFLVYSFFVARPRAGQARCEACGDAAQLGPIDDTGTRRKCSG